MNDGLQTNLFVGVLINEKLQEHLDQCEPYNERFFKRNNPEYLQVTTSGEKSYIGKRLDKRVDFESLDNIIQNVLSILKIICPNYYFDRAQICLFSEISIG